MAETRSWTLKADLAGDLRRARPWPPVGSEASAAAAREAVQKLFELSEEDVACLVLKYQDETGDWCTLADSTLADALHLAEAANGVLRLTVLREVQAERQQPAAAAAPTEAGGRPQQPTQDSWSPLDWLQREVSTTVSELTAAATERGGLRAYSATLQGRLQDRAEEAVAAASQARAAATEAYGHVSEGGKTGLGLAAAVAVPAAVVAMAPGRCVRLGILAAGALAAAKLSDHLSGDDQRDLQVEKEQQPAAEEVQTPAAHASDEGLRQRSANNNEVQGADA